MSTVKVDTETLRAGGDTVKKLYEDNKTNYTVVSNTSIEGCASYDNFKSALKNKFESYGSHATIMSEKLVECADTLEETDNTIMSSTESTTTERIKTVRDGFPVSDTYVNPYDPDNLPDITLYDSNGVLKFTQNGKKVYETFCNTCLKHSDDLRFLILKMGYDAGFWYREDGVQMWGEDVMYGGDIPEWNEGGIEDENHNPSNSTRRRGDKFYGTSGPGRIVGYGGTSVDAHLGEFSPDGTAYDETYDTYTAWRIDKYSGNYDEAEYQKYSSRYYSKQEEYATRNVIDNPPLDPSERYYQTNKDWVDLFGKYPLTREYIPDGVVDWKTDEWKTFDWEAYFQINNPDRISA